MSVGAPEPGGVCGEAETGGKLILRPSGEQMCRALGPEQAGSTQKALGDGESLIFPQGLGGCLPAGL